MAVKIISISELRQRLKDLLATLDATGEPYFITQYSRPKAVLVRYDDYNALTEQGMRAHPHIVRRPEISGGEPLIRGTRITVQHIVEQVQAGHTVDTILAALPHLTPAQVYAALTYYYDHQAELDRLLEESRLERVVTTQGLQVEPVTEGVAVVHDAAGRW
jgi:prevent-host-death family protein